MFSRGFQGSGSVAAALSGGAGGSAPSVLTVAIEDMGVGPNGGHVYAADGTYSDGAETATLTYQWNIDGSPVSGATAPTFDNDFLYQEVGSLTVTVTATNAFGSDDLTSSPVSIISFARYADPDGKFPVLILDFQHGVYAADAGHGLALAASASALISNISAIEDSGDGENGLRINAGTSDHPTVALSSFFFNTDVVEGNTIYVKARIDTGAANSRLVQIDDGSSANRIGLYLNSGLVSWRMLMGVASVEQASTAQVIAYSAGTEVRIAYAHATNSLVAVGNGGTPVTDSAATVPTGLTTLRLGHQFGDTLQPTAGYIKCLCMFPYRMADATADSLSGNAAYGDPV